MKKIACIFLLLAGILAPVFSDSKKSMEYMNKAKTCLVNGEIVWAYYYYGCAFSEDDRNIEALEKRDEIYTFIKNGDISLGKEQLDDFELHDRWLKIINDYYYVSIFSLDVNEIFLSAYLSLENVNYDTRTYDYKISISKRVENKTEVESIRTAIEEGLEIVKKSTWTDISYYVTEFDSRKLALTEEELIKNNYFINGAYFSCAKEISDNKKVYTYPVEAFRSISFNRENGHSENNIIFDVEILNKEGKVILSKTIKSYSDEIIYSVKEPIENLSVRIKKMTLLYGTFDETTSYKHPDGYMSFCISDQNFNKLKKIIYNESDFKDGCVDWNLRNDRKLDICNKNDFIILNEKNNNVYTYNNLFSISVQHDENLINNRNYDVLLYSDIEKNATEEEFLTFIEKERILRRKKIPEIDKTTNLLDTYLVYNKAKNEVYTNNLILSAKDFDLSKYKIVDYERLRDDEEYYTKIKNEINEAQLVYDNIKQYFSYSFNKWNYSTRSYTPFNTHDLEAVTFKFYDKERNLLFSKNKTEKVLNPKNLLAEAEGIDSFIIVVDKINADTNLKEPIDALVKKVKQYYSEIYYKYYVEMDARKELEYELKNTYLILGTGIAGKSTTVCMNMSNVFYTKIDKQNVEFKTYYIFEGKYGFYENYTYMKPNAYYPSVEEMKENKKKWALEDDLYYLVKNDEEESSTIYAWNPKKDKIKKYYKSSSKDDLRVIKVYSWKFTSYFPGKYFTLETSK